MPLYSSGTLLKASDPCPILSLKCVATLVRLRSSSRVPFINHSTLVIVPDDDTQSKITLPPRITMPRVSVTRNQIETHAESHTLTELTT